MTERIVAGTDLVRTERPVSELCKGKCRGVDELGYSTRPAGDSPAKFGRNHSGQKVLWCPCCGYELVWEERLPNHLKVIVAQHRPPNLNQDLTTTAWRRFCDLICEYDVVVLKDLIPV